MTGHRDCDLDGCEGRAAWQIRFELTEPSDATQVLGTFRLCVCEAHARDMSITAEAVEAKLLAEASAITRH